MLKREDLEHVARHVDDGRPISGPLFRAAPKLALACLSAATNLRRELGYMGERDDHYSAVGKCLGELESALAAAGVEVE